MAEKKTTSTSAAEDTSELKSVSIKTTGAVRFCRAGQRFGRSARIVTDYTPEQLAAWQAEQYLIVEFV